jgi:hypothetical protein
VNETSRRILRLEKDLREIKRTLDRNKSILRVLFEKSFRFLPLLGFSGLASALISVSYYIALRTFGSPGEIPAAFHWVLGTLIAVSLAVVSVLKLFVFVREAKKLDDERSSYVILLVLLKSSTMLHVFLPVMALIVTLSLFLISLDLAPYCVAVWAIGCGIIWNAIGAEFSLIEYIIFGYWLLLTGTLSIFVTGIHPLLWIGAIFGLGFTCFAAILWIVGRKAGR